MGYRRELRPPDDQFLTLDIADLSLSGLGLRYRAVTIEQLPVGTIVQKCRLDFRSQGDPEFDLQVVGHGLVRRDQRALHHIRCAFVFLSRSLQTFLQRFVYHIELAGRESSF